MLFKNVPEKPGMAFVVIVHLAADFESQLHEIVGRSTSMTVVQVREQVIVEADHVYVISPAKLLSMQGDHLHVDELHRLSGGRPSSIDHFFRTLAEVQRERSVCVVLSGTGADGSLGVKRIKECGGVALVQTPEDAEYDGMPSSAIATGTVDFVLPAAAMAGKLVELWANAQAMELPAPADLQMRVSRPANAAAAEHAEAALNDVMLLLRNATGHDFRHYKRATVLRRIERRLQVNSLPTLPEYRSYLAGHPEESWALLNDLLISVTNFFRDRDAFDALEREIASSLVETPRAAVRAWVAACATGEEAYSVAMLLSERTRHQRPEPAIQVFASDIDERAIGVARAGVYPNTVVADLTPGRLGQFMQKEDGNVRVRKELREKVLFATHNLLRDPPFSNLDLVCCRNLLIYLDREVQEQVLRLFHFALRPGGLLFLGMSESADAVNDLFVPVDKKHRIYRSDGVRRGRRTTPMLPATETFPQMPMRATVPAEPRAALGELHERAREQVAAPSVLIDRSNNILHSTLRASAYLRFAPGQPSQDLLAAVRPELRIELRTALAQAWQQGQSVESRPVKVDGNGQASWISMSVRPVANSEVPLVLVFFNDAQYSFGLEASEAHEKDPMFDVLEEELQRTREQLNGTLGESAASGEELRASNEELQAINEELRSATEELETGKEELQSVNEELFTVNQELKAKIDETSKSNDDLTNLIASTDIATVFVDRAMHIKRFTPRASTLFNLISSDVGRSLLDITHRLDYPQLAADTGETFASLRSIEREVKGADGKIYLVRLLPYRTQHDVIDGAVLTFIDISAARRAQEQLRIGEANLQLVVERTQDYAIITLDTNGLVTTWNQGAQRMFGYDDAEMIGQPLDILFTPEDRAAGVPQAEMARARDTGRALDERWHMTKDGSHFYCSGIMTPIHEQGRLLGYAKIARDQTDRKQSESQLETLLIQEKETRAELQRAITMKDEFLAVMSHELKHPLNLIHVNAELLSRMPQVRDSPNVARAADVIRRTVLSQAKIIDDLLDLSRLRTGKLALSTELVNWESVITRVIDAVAHDAQVLQLSLRADLDPGASMIEADPVRAEQIVWNLVSNALKFTPAGGKVQVRLTVDGADARLDVIDTGQGIAQDFLEHVFDMFRQADRSTTRPQGGMGIGLALVKQLVEAHGGRVAVDSAGAGKGSTFSVWMPLADAETANASLPRGVPALSGMRILLVDDAEDALQSFAALLGLEGADVVAVSSGRQALAAIEQAPFDLLLSDVAMPGMDGYELIVAIRGGVGDGSSANVAAIALTGFGRPMDTRRALAAGFDAHLAKPIVIEDLLQIIQHLPRLTVAKGKGASDR
jgi:two-component system CheB/CheR fusion protein